MLNLQNQNDTDGAASGPGGSKPTLTPKQRKFADAYPSAGSGVQAARSAGYRGNAAVLAVQASVNLRNPKIQQHIAAILDGMTERALQAVDDALDATTSRAFLDKNGVVVYTEPVPDHRTRVRAAESGSP